MTGTATPSRSRPRPTDRRHVAALHDRDSDLRTLVTRNLRQSGIYIAFVAIVALFAILTDGVSLSPGNITNIVLQYSYILILAIGMVHRDHRGPHRPVGRLGRRAHRRGLRGRW